ncbi:ribosomal protein L22/L17 [Zychaea mexicana]|uniref:ribosomal protein L22/L17 n=1 Tax=Zychaea mexicana TaxID=64656 RepID=UPI0022FE937B|nr:ribosomal protein L22/L17 [Zychaea mexicana]KAI9495949.1 ribosomal protein L22/L17 [Zychaea mexicana]
MASFSLTSAFRAVCRPLSQPTRLQRFSTAPRRLAEQPATSRPDVGASSLFENVTVESGKEQLEHGEKAVKKQYQWSSTNMKGSPRKLNMLARQIRNLPVDEAIKQMEFSPKRTARKIMHNLAFARKNAAEQKDMQNLIVAQAWVGKGRYIKRIRPHGRGQFGIMHHKESHIKFLLEEAPQADQEAITASRRNIRGWKDTKKVWTPLKENKPIYNPKAFYNW